MSDDPYFCGHMYLSWVKVSLHTVNQVPRLPGSFLKVLLLMTLPAQVEMSWAVTLLVLAL